MDPPCETPTEDRETGETVYRCKFGLVDLWDVNWPTMNAWRYLRVLGAEAGMKLLTVAIGEKEVGEMAEDLVLLQSAQNQRDRAKLGT